MILKCNEYRDEIFRSEVCGVCALLKEPGDRNQLLLCSDLPRIYRAAMFLQLSSMNRLFAGRFLFCSVLAIGLVFFRGAADLDTMQGAEPNSAKAGKIQKPAKEYFQLHNLLKVGERIYSGGEPVGEEAFRQLKDLNVKVVVSVDGARPDVETAEKYGLRYVHIPIGYDGIPEAAGQSLARMVKDLEGAFYIHCHHGTHRGPAAAAAACIADGERTPQAALEILQAAGTSPNYKGLWRDVGTFTPPPAGAEWPELVSVAEVDSLTAAMSQIDRVYDRLKLMQGNDWKTPAEHPDLVPHLEALLMKEAFRESARHLDPKAPEELRRWLKRAEGLSGELEQALQAGHSAAQLDQSFKSMQNSCKQCHDRFRD